MLTIKDLNGNTEALTDFNGLEIVEQVNGDFSSSFTCFISNQYSYPLIVEESFVEIFDQEFRIKKLDEVRNRKSILAQHIFFDLIDFRQETIFGGTHTADEFMAFALSGTGWTFENIDVTDSALIMNFGNANVLALVIAIRQAFNCETKIEPGRHIKLYKEIGADNDFQFRYKSNIKTLKKSVDTTKLSTAIKGYGGNGLVVEYHSPNETLYGTRWAEPITEDDILDSSLMIEKLKQELQDIPEVSIEIESVILGFDAQLGDKVWVIYEPMNIEFQTRVMERRTYPFSNRSPVVTLSNKKPTITDLLTETKIEVKENQKQVTSKINQTNDRITLEVNSINDQFTVVETKFEVMDGKIESKVSLTDFTGTTITSLITQDAYSISFLAQQLNLQGLVTIKNLNTPGETIIDGSNLKTGTVSADVLWGNLFRVGNGVTDTKMELYTADNSAHYIKSTQAAGFRIESSGSLSLYAGSDYGIYANNAPLVANAGFRANGTSQFNNGLTVNGILGASYIMENGVFLAGLYADINHSHYEYMPNTSYPSFDTVYASSFSSSGSGTPFRAYIGMSVLAMELYSGSAYFSGDVYAKNVKLTSDEAYKKDIETYSDSALALIENTPIFSYRFKDEDESLPKTIGVIAQLSPDEIVYENKDGLLSVSEYEMVALAWKAIQELKTEIELLKGE